MNINYKDLFYIFHPDGKFTEEQLLKILDAAYAEGHKKGYNEGYEVGKNRTFHIEYPYTDWWKSPWYATTTAIGKTNITPMSITTTSNPSSTTTTATTATTATCSCKNNSNCDCTKSESPYGMEFKYNGTEK